MSSDGSDAGNDRTFSPSDTRDSDRTRLFSDSVMDAFSGEAPLPQASADGYEIISELGRGAISIVYKARQMSLDRVVAVKVLRRGVRASDEEQARFIREAQIISSLRHPGIVQVYEARESSGELYLIMELIDGVNLADRSRKSPMDPLEAARIIKQASEAVHHCHKHGVLHRDLKPSNMIVGEDDRPKLIDFGLAHLSDDDDLTREGQFLGTPGFMPPEQTAIKVENLTPACDVYSLGASLYALLTGKPPFVGKSFQQTVAQVQNMPPMPVRQLSPDVAVDLETICLKCLEKSPKKRYGTASALAEDLERFLEKKRIRARRISGVERFRRWMHRNPKIGATIAGVLLGLAMLTISLAVAAMGLNRERIAVEQSNELLVNQFIRMGNDYFEVGMVDNGILAFANAVEKAGNNEQKVLAQRLVNGWWPKVGRVYLYGDGANPIWAVDDEGRWLVTADGQYVHVWDLTADRLVNKMEMNATAIHLLPQNRLLLVDEKNTIRSINLESEAEVATAELGFPVHAFDYSAITNQVLAWNSEHLALLDADSLVVATERDTEHISHARFSTSGQFVFLGTGTQRRDDGKNWFASIGVWDTSRSIDNEIAFFDRHRSKITGIVTDDESGLLITTSTDASIHLWKWQDTTLSKEPWEFPHRWKFESEVVACDFHRNEREQLLFAYALSSGEVVVRRQDGKRWLDIHRESLGQGIHGVRLVSDNQLLVNLRDRVRLYEVPGNVFQRERDLTQWIGSPEKREEVTALVPDHQLASVAIGYRDGQAWIWDRSGNVQHRFAPPSDPPIADDRVKSVGFLAESKRIVVVNASGIARLLDLESGGELDRHTYEHPVQHAQVSPNGKVLLLDSVNRKIVSLQCEEGKLQVEPDSSETGADKSTTDAANGKSNVLSSRLPRLVARSPDNKYLVVASDDHILRVYDADGNLLNDESLKCSGLPVTISFSPDGSLIACGDNRHRIRVWHFYSGLLIGPPILHPEREIRSITFSPEGDYVVWGDFRGGFSYWKIPKESLSKTPWENVRLRLEVATGRELNDERFRFPRLTFAQWFERKQQLRRLSQDYE